MTAISSTPTQTRLSEVRGAMFATRSALRDARTLAPGQVVPGVERILDALDAMEFAIGTLAGVAEAQEEARNERAA